MSLKYLALVSLVILLAFSSGFSQEAEPVSDTQTYLNALESVKGKSLETQVEIWRQLLANHPNSQFRPEIEKNVQNLEELLIQSDPAKKKETQDTEIYLRAVDFSKTLSSRDQMDLWVQFLEENPDNLFRPDVEHMLRELERRHAPPQRVQPRVKPRASQDHGLPETPVSLDLAFKDENRALLYATFVGLLVPGIGHWYANDYLIAGAMTALRVAGLAVGIPAIINRNQALMITGGVLTGFSYLVDVADTPYAVRRYNEALEQHQAHRQVEPTLAFSFSF